VGIPVSTKRTELPGLSVAANSFIKRASIPTSVSAPQAALAAAFRRIRPVSDPEKLKLNVPSALKSTDWCSLTLPCSSLTASVSHF